MSAERYVRNKYCTKEAESHKCYKVKQLYWNFCHGAYTSKYMAAN
jgi:hypothetical protein